MSDFRKIAVACFVGGTVGVLVTLLVEPQFWTAGLLAGFTGGYLAYEFRKILQAIPSAARTAASGLDQFVFSLVSYFTEKERPYTVLHLFIFGMLTLGIFLTPAPWLTIPDALSRYVLRGELMVGAFFLALLLGGIYVMFAALGAHVVEKTSFKHSIVFGRPYQYPVVERTLPRVLRWGAEGIVIFVPWLLVTLAKAFGSIALFLVFFTIVLVRYTLTERRMFCGLNAALATALSYWYFVRPDPRLDLAHALTIVLGGGVMSMLLAALSWELISKRLLKLVPVAR